jgi:hypothetical protein
MTGGFGDPNNSAIRAMAYQSSTLFAVTSNAQTGLNIYSTNNGLMWGGYLEYPGFGNGTNTQVDLDSSVTFDPSGRMLVGTWNTDNGGALWASNPPPNSITGVVSDSHSGLGLPGVQVTLQPGNQQTTTSGGGIYTFSNLLPGSYTITPNLANYAFTPPSQVINITNASVIGVNFTGVSGAITLQAPANGTQFASLDPVALQWASNGVATKYTLQVSISSSFSPLFKNVTVTGLSYSLSGLKSNTTYYWQVRQAAPTPAGAWSAPWSFTTPVPPAAPAQLLPANRASLPAGVFSPTFTWKAATVPAGSAPVQHYHLQVSRLNTFVTLDLDEYTPGTGTSYTALFDLTGNRTYYWRVRAFNTIGDYGAWSSVRTFKTLPEAVTSAWMYEGAPHFSLTLQPGFHWVDPACTGKYLLQIYKSIPSHPLVKSATVSTGTACQGDYQLTTSLALNTLYEWRISAQGAYGTSLPVINTFTTPAVVPGTPVLLGPANNEAIPDTTYPDWQPTFSWQAVTTGSPGGYEIQIANLPGFGSSTFVDFPIDLSTTSVQVSPPLAYNTTVYWRVRACQESCSVWSAARKLVTRPGQPIDLNADLATKLDTTFTWSDPGHYPNSANSYSLVIYSNLGCTTPWKTLASPIPSAHVMLTAGAPYCVKVRGVGPTSSITGPYSDPLTFTAIKPPAAPVLVAPANNALIANNMGGFNPYQVDFSWKASSPPSPGDTVNYELQVSQWADFRTSLVDDSGLAVTSATHYFSASKWYWRVRAYVGSASSPWSAVRSFSTPGQIAGNVSGEYTHGLDGVTVALSGVSGSTTTDSSGNYHFANLPAGAHTLTLSKTGWLTQTRTVTVANAVYLSEPFLMLQTAGTTADRVRIVLTWNPGGGRDLKSNLWLPPATPFHLVNPNIGKVDLDTFPHALVNGVYPGFGLAIIDVKPVAGNYVFAVNQLIPASTSWSGASAKVEVYSDNGTTLTLLKTCLQPSGSGRWWYAFDLNGSSVTCKNSMRAAAPAPYPDASPITGHVYALNTHHPLGGVFIDFGPGKVMTDQNGFYSIPFLAPGSYNLTPNGWGLQSFSPPSRTGVATGTNGMDFTGTVDSDLSPGSLYTEAIQGDYAYLGANGWLYIVNIHNKSAPVEVSRLWIDQANIQSIVVSGAYAYLAGVWEGGTEVNVVDVSDPSHPQWVSFAPLEANTVPYNQVVYGQYLFVSAGRYVYIYQQSAAPAPSLTRLVTLDLGVSNAASWVAVSGHYAYVTGSQGLYIYDITNPAHPSAPWHYPAFWGYYNLVVEGQYAYLGADDGLLLVLNVADPAHVYQVSRTTMESSRLEKAGIYLYAVTPSSEKQLLIMNVGDPANPFQLSSTPFSGETLDVKVQENYAFVIDAITGSGATSHLHILDVTSKTAPVEVGSYTPAP